MYFLISLVVLLVSGVLFRIAAGSLSLRRLNMISWVFYYNLVLQSFIGAVLVMLYLGHTRVQNLLQSHQPIFLVWFSVCYVMLLLPIGMIVAQRVFRRSVHTSFLAYLKRPVESSLALSNHSVRGYLLVLSVIGILSVLYTFYISGTEPILNIFNHSTQQLALSRIDVTHEFSGVVYIRNIFALILVPILAYVTFIYWRENKTLVDGLWFMVMFVGAIFALTYNLAKSPILLFILGFFVLNILHRGTVPWRRLAGYVIVVMGLAIVLYMVIAGVTSWQVLFSLNSGLVGRILFSQLAGMYLSFQLFPDIHPFIGWSSMSHLIGHMLNLPYSDRVARIIMEYANPIGVREGIAGVMNSLFIEEAWGNFGWTGLLISHLYIGALLGVFYLFLLTRRKTPVLLGFFAYYTVHSNITGGFNGYIYDPGFWVVVIVLAFPYFISLIFRTDVVKK